MEIRPAIDIIEGKCVRLTQGDYDRKTVYNEDPLEVALEFEGEGLTHLHLVDLDGAKASHIVNYNILERIATKTNLSIDFGGGIKTMEDARIAFESGAMQITGGSLAVKNPAMFSQLLEKYGADAVILGADAKDGKIAVGGWLETTDADVYEFVQSYADKGVKYVISTDIAKDGAMQGPSFELYQTMLEKTPTAFVIASGGVTSMDDLEQLSAIGCGGAIVGKAIYEGAIDLKTLARTFVN